MKKILVFILSAVLLLTVPAPAFAAGAPAASAFTDADRLRTEGEKLVNADGKIVFEVKLPETLFQVTDVDGAAEFKLGNEKLYFGMFGVIGGGGYTNQSAAPGSSWNCVDLGIHEYFIK